MIASRLLAERSMVVSVALRSVEIGFQRQAGKADHPIERGAQLVRHIGQELRYLCAPPPGAAFRQVQLDVLDLHLLERFL